jgi:hypothetical protein
MIKVGDKVALFMQMNRVGIAVELREAKVETWMVGGAMSKSFVVVVEYPDKEFVTHRMDELMRVD